MARILAAAAGLSLVLALPACEGGGSGGGGGATPGGLCFAETIGEPSGECQFGEECYIEGCTGRCAAPCDGPEDATCPDAMGCTEYEPYHCVPVKDNKCDPEGEPCGEGMECVLWVDCGDTGLYHWCLPEAYEVPDAE